MSWMNIYIYKKNAIIVLVLCIVLIKKVCESNMIQQPRRPMTTEFPGGLQISHNSLARPWKGHSPTLCLSHYLYHSALTQFFNKQCMTLWLLLHSCYIYTSLCSLVTPSNRTLWYDQCTRGLRTHNMVWKVWTLSQVRHPELIALYASAPNHVFGQMFGLPGSWVCCLTFCFIG